MTVLRRPLPGALRRAGPLAIAGLVANAMGVIITVGVARLLESREYGALAQLLGMFLVLQMPGSALIVAVVRRVTGWENEGRTAEVAPWAARARRYAVIGVAVFVVLAVALRGVVADWRSWPDAGGVAEILVAGAVWLVLSFERGLLQSRLAFPALDGNLVLEAVARAVLVLGLVGAGLGVEGAALGVLVAVSAAAAHARVAASRTLNAYPAQARAGVQSSGREGRKLAVDAAAALGALALLALLQSVDVIIVGRERPSASGSYAAVSVASKALVFLAIALSGYLLPEAASRWQRGEHALGPLAAAAALVGLPALGLLGIALVAPHQFLATFFGERLASASDALAPLVLAMACLALSVLCTHYLLGVGQRWVVALLAVGAVVTAAALLGADGEPVATARADLACQAGITAVTGLLVVGVHRRTRKVRLAST